jgi:hypothetical protein
VGGHFILSNAPSPGTFRPPMVNGFFWLFLLVLASFSFIGEFLPNFDLENVTSTYTKDFSWKK